MKNGSIRLFYTSLVLLTMSLTRIQVLGSSHNEHYKISVCRLANEENYSSTSSAIKSSYILKDNSINNNIDHFYQVRYITLLNSLKHLTSEIRNEQSKKDIQEVNQLKNMSIEKIQQLLQIIKEWICLYVPRRVFHYVIPFYFKCLQLSLAYLPIMKHACQYFFLYRSVCYVFNCSMFILSYLWNYKTKKPAAEKVICLLDAIHEQVKKDGKKDDICITNASKLMIIHNNQIKECISTRIIQQLLRNTEQLHYLIFSLGEYMKLMIYNRNIWTSHSSVDDMNELEEYRFDILENQLTSYNKN